MNRNKLKTYAPEARREFIQAMNDRAAFFGLTAKAVEPIVVRGDVAVIAGRDYPRAVADKRWKLEARIARDGFEQTMEAMAYTWFNRFVAIRFMELHGYLDHGYRVLSHPDGKPIPEILEHAEHVELPGINKDRAIDLKLEGNKENELYRLLLTAQCNALHRAMPFLFERIDDETELLLPDNLLHSNSLVRNLIEGIDEEDWKEVEIIGWLYQFYISEKKDDVIGKVVASADIPAATQLFTPNWIVKYLVQNTLGRQWLATYPNSPLRTQMDFYIEPVEQPSDVKDQLKVSTHPSLDPEALTMLDPACGSCHILVEGYDLFKSIYLERGYRLKDIPALILQKNLFGLEIDDRAAQLGAFALMMKARADDRRIFERDAKPNVLSFQESNGIDAAAMAGALNAPSRKGNPREFLFEEIDEAETPLLTRKPKEVAPVSTDDIAAILALFKGAKTFGSLIKVPPALKAKLPAIEERVDDVLKHGDLVQSTALVLKPILQQARLLAGHYNVVVANPPYMGGKYFAEQLKLFVAEHFKQAKADLYACFIQRNISFVEAGGLVGMITIPNWMFLSSFEDVRTSLFDSQTIESLIHNGRGIFGSDFGSCSFVIRNETLPNYRGTFRKLFEKPGSVASNEELQERFFSTSSYSASPLEFKELPGSPVAYWVSSKVRSIFRDSKPFRVSAPTKQGLATTNNDLFLRGWHEVSVEKICFDATSEADAERSGKKWFPCNKGGDFRRWFGNNYYVVNYENRGKTICDYIDNTPGVKVKSNGRVINRQYYFRPGLTWSSLSISAFAMRYCPSGYVFETKGSMCFPVEPSLTMHVLGFCNSKLLDLFLGALSPTVDYHEGPLGNVPFVPFESEEIDQFASELVEIATKDWNLSETSWHFEAAPQIAARSVSSLLSEVQSKCDAECTSRLVRMKELEEKINRLLIDAYGLQEELTPDVSGEHITLYRPDREEDARRLLSYAIGCMMGRFSLDEPGLTYAGSGNQGFDRTRYSTFPADEDGIIPLLGADWGVADDAAKRMVEFFSAAWPAKEHLDDNLRFVADSLGAVNGEQPRDTIRRYLSTGFYKHHLSTYKKRPIYWLFSSGKSRAFQCLVYLHRYNEGTLARIRTEHVIPLQGKIAARIEQIEGEKIKASSTSHRKKLQKEQDELKKQQTELLAFEEKLKHFADQMISIDLDDGVKSNYGKFGDLLAEVKSVTGGKDDE